MTNKLGSFWRDYRAWISPWQIFQGGVAAILLAVAGLLPTRVAANAGSAVARTIGPLLPWHRRGMANLAHVYPDMPPADRRAIMSGVWDNLGRTMGEFARLRQVGPTVTVSGFEHIPPAGTPTIFVTAHMANWEALTWLSRLCGRPIMNVYRRPNNVYVDRLLKTRTRDLPIELIEKDRRAGIHLLQQLRAGGAINLFVDQKGTTGDVVVPFLGRDAQTVRTPAVLAAKTGAVVVPGRMVRIARHRLEIVVDPPLPPLTETGDAAEHAYMKQINDILGRWIEETPEQWLWIHRRWKNTDALVSEAPDDAVEPGARQPSST